MGRERLIREADVVLGLSRRAPASASAPKEWSEEHSLYVSAYLAEGFGLGAVIAGKGVTVDAGAAKLHLERVMPPPLTITGMPVQDSEGIWWSAVADSIRDGVLMDASGLPAIGSVVDGYQRYLERKGLKLTDEKKRELSEWQQAFPGVVLGTVSAMMISECVDKRTVERLIEARK